MKETWIDVKGYEGLYMVSNLGRVKSLPKPDAHLYNERILKPSSTNNGYMGISLSKDKVVRRFLVHRLVATAFVENKNPQIYKMVNHKDEDPSNNKASNLEWCTIKYNLHYSNVINKLSEGRINRLQRPILMFKDNVFVREFKSQTEAAEFVNGQQQNVYNCCIKKAKRHKGYEFRFKYEFDKRHTKKLRVARIDENDNIIKEFESIREAGKYYKIQPSKICYCCKGKQNKTRNMRFKYLFNI